MKANQLKRIIRQLREAASAISEIDEDVFDCLAENGCGVPMPQQLEELADRLEPLVSGDGAYASKKVCQEDHPGAKIYTDPWGRSFAL